MSGQPPSPGSDRRDPLSFDELVALIVAFLAIGAVLWWSLGRRAESWFGQQLRPAGEETAESTSGFGLAESDRAAEIDPEAETEAAVPVSPVPGAVDGATAVVPPEPRTVPRTAVIPGIPAVVAPAPAASPEATPAAPTQSSRIVVPSASPGATVAFPDLSPQYWAYPFIAELARRGMISGFEDGTFRPDQPVTRAQYASLISEVLPEAQQNPLAFADVPVGFWGKPAIDEAVKTGFLKGYPDTTFQPDQPISRMQVLLSLANGFQLPRPADPNAPLQVFQDREQIAEWARPAVAAATQSNVVVSYPNVNQLNPNQPATRADVAAMLYQALTTTGQLPPIQSNYIARP
jgi:hypothetical protein